MQKRPTRTLLLATLAAHRRKVIAAACVVAAVYLAGPVIAARFEIGNRCGPRIYPEWLHEPLYLIAWQMTTHDETKPRLSIGFRSEFRPWFYGMASENDDPAYQQAEAQKRRERLAAERVTTRPRQTSPTPALPSPSGR